VPALKVRSKATSIFVNADVTPYSRRRDERIDDQLVNPMKRSWGSLVHPPGSVVSSHNRTSRIFTPFFKRWIALPPQPTVGPTFVHVLDDVGDGLPRLSATPFQSGGEDAAMERLADFSARVDEYNETRDLPAIAGTSMLSVDLRFGTLSPRAVAASIGTATTGRTAFVRQLAWRDWYAHLLYEDPAMATHNVRSNLDHLSWNNDPSDIKAWQHGLTGFPLVDAGMRELAATGWMHNRVRMVVASFLVKDLLVDWRIGERWFRHLLVDADVAQNVGNWQWSAGTGFDAAPYFRVFNPVTQSRRFDPRGAYIKSWLPELAGMPPNSVHAPWTASPEVLSAAGVTLGVDFPFPIIDHAFARQRALSAYASK
jgi:deoxyribodipyrimidine photo-lyase